MKWKEGTRGRERGEYRGKRDSEDGTKRATGDREGNKRRVIKGVDGIGSK